MRIHLHAFIDRVCNGLARYMLNFRLPFLTQVFSLSTLAHQIHMLRQIFHSMR